MSNSSSLNSGIVILCVCFGCYIRLGGNFVEYHNFLSSLNCPCYSQREDRFGNRIPVVLWLELVYFVLLLDVIPIWCRMS